VAGARVSKVLSVAAAVVAVAAVTVASAGVLAPAATATALGSVGITASASALATGLSLTAAGLSVGAALLAKKPKPDGNPMAWTADPQAPIPYAMGRCYVAGNIIYRQAYGDNNKWQVLTTILSGAGPVQSIDQLYVDNVATAVSADTTVEIPGRGFFFERRQLGQTPETTSLQVGQGGYAPGWGPANKLSGYAATTVQLVYDTKGKQTLTSTPQCGWVGHWVKVYDPRKDSTYPGGSGAHRANDETTWEWSDNPALHALTWLIGRRQNGKPILGVGAPMSGIIVSQYVEAANIADANSWKLGGVVYSTDDKWDALKKMLQACSAEPIRLGAQVGCIINTPRVSLATITVDDVVGDASVQATQATRDRINTIVPRYMAEQSTTTSVNGTLTTAVTWGMVAGSPVVVQDYVAFDGKQRQREVEYSLVQDLTQSQQLARYDIENAREFGPITLPLKLRWMGYKPGDVVTVNLPELGLVNQTILLLSRELSPEDATVTMTARSETNGKHAFALGQTGTPPGTPTVGGAPLVPTASATEWQIAGTAVSANGTTIPALVITGGATSSMIDGIVFEYRVANGALGEDDDWQAGGIEPPTTQTKVITGLLDNTSYQVSVSYRKGPASSQDRLILGPVTVSSSAIPWSGVTGPGKPEDGATRNVFTGPYDANKVYYPGDEAEDQAAAWLYIGATPDKGHAPPTLPTESNAWWRLYVRGTTQSLIDDVEGIVSDQVLSRPEKQALILDVAAIQSERPQILGRAATLSVDTAAYTSAYNALMTFLSGLSPAWNDTSQDTPLPDRTTLLSRVEAYYSQRDAMEAQLGQSLTDEIAITNEAAAAAQTAAGQASSLASTANAAAALGAQMAADIADNGKFSSAEKKRWVERINSLDSTVPAEITQGNALGLQTQTSALQTAYTNLKNYLISVGYSDVGHTSSINSGTFKGWVAAFDVAEQNLANAAQAYAQSMSVIITSNLVVDPLFLRPTDSGSWQGVPGSTTGGQDDTLGRRAYFNASSGDVAWATPTFQLGSADRLDIDFDWYLSSGVAGTNGGQAFGIWVSGFDAAGNSLWNNAVVTFYSDGRKNQWLRQRGSINVADQANGARTAKAFLYIQAQGHTGGAVYIRNPRVQKAGAATALLNGNGRATTALLNSTSLVAGIKAINNVGSVLSQTNAGSNVTVNVAAFSFNFDNGSGANYPSASIVGLAYSTTYYFWRDDPNLDGGTGYGVSTSLYDAMGPSKVYLGYFTTMSNAGTGGGGGGAAGGIGNQNCVDEDAWVAAEHGRVRAGDIKAGDRIWALTDDMTSMELVPVLSNEIAAAAQIRIETEGGGKLTLAFDTPMDFPLADGARGQDIAANCWAFPVATWTGAADAAPNWERALPKAAGDRRRVAKISIGGRVYAASDTEDGPLVLSHNVYK